MKRILLFLLLSAAAHGQGTIQYVQTAPAGACGYHPLIEIVMLTGQMYTCANGTWTGQGGGSGGGTTTYSLTFNASGSGAIPGNSFNGSQAFTLSYNSIGAAPLISPTFTGIPIVPTATYGTNSTQAASTAFVQTAVAGGGGGGSLLSLVNPSGDMTGATDGAAIQAACNSTHGVQLNAGTYYVGHANTVIAITAPCRVIGLGKSTVIQNEGTSNDIFRISYYTTWVESPWSYPASTNQSEFAWFQLAQDSSVTPTAGYGFDIGSGISESGGTYQYTMNVHVHDTVANGLWGGLELQNDELYAFVDHNMWRQFVGGGAVYLDAEVGSGDNHIENNEFSGLTYSGIIISQSDTTSFASDKLNGSGIQFTGVTSAQSVRFTDMSIETGISQPCAIDFGTGLPSRNIQFTGSEQYGFVTLLCHQANTWNLAYTFSNQQGTSDAPYGLITNSGYRYVSPAYQDYAAFLGTSGTLLSAYTTQAGKTFALYTGTGIATQIPQLSGSGSAVLPSGTDSTYGDSLDTLTPASTNYTVAMTCTLVGGAPTMGLFARAASGSNTNYAAQYEGSTGVFQLFSQYGGGSHSLAFSSFTWPVGSSQNMTLSVNGTQIFATLGNVSLGPIIDSGVTGTGQAGLRITGGSDVTCTNFSVL